MEKSKDITIADLDPTWKFVEEEIKREFAKKMEENQKRFFNEVRKIHVDLTSCL